MRDARTSVSTAGDFERAAKSATLPRVKESERITEQLKRAFEGGAWHGPSVREALEAVTAAEAAARPIPNAHSIWELVLHITAWESIVRRRLRGENVDVTPQVDWPKVHETTDAAWARAIDELTRGHLQLRETAAGYDDARLDDKPAGGSTAYVLLHGAIQHDLYHAGQIVLLRKRAK